MDTLSFSLLILFTSLISCYLPYMVSTKSFMRKYISYISTYAASLLLSVLLMDFIPHLIKGPCGSTKLATNYNISLFAGGLAFIVLLGIDCVFLNHSCESEKIKQETAQCGKKDACSDKHDHVEIFHSENYDEVPSMCSSTAIKNSKTVFESLIFTFALSLHSFLEGLAANPTGKLSSYEIALVVHKILESLSSSLNLQNSQLSMSAIFLIFAIFSILTPSGIMLSGLAKGDSLLFSIFNGSAFGSLLFIIFVEMIPASFHTKKNGKRKLALLIFGFAINSFLIYKAHQPHHHHHHHHH